LKFTDPPPSVQNEYHRPSVPVWLEVIDEAPLVSVASRLSSPPQPTNRAAITAQGIIFLRFMTLTFRDTGCSSGASKRPSNGPPVPRN